ncbi:MAG: M20/M25/M40 family metallo-hydrolase [Phycisphaeraceae bacterium]|nr:M20/M25/M40 family metallo-hydrolase [Phycisphaeraceae bacterium]
MQHPSSLSAVEERLCREVARRGALMVEDLERYVHIPTKTGYVTGLETFRGLVCERLASAGATVELVPGQLAPDWLYGSPAQGEVPPSAVCRRTSGRDGVRVLLSGHLDTVHPPESAFRSFDFGPGDERATGPGCVDMKGGLVIALHALEALEEIGVAPAWSFIFNSDEETGSYHSEEALRAEAGKHDIGLVFEPAMPGGELVVERMGSGQFMLEARGRSAHVGRDFFNGGVSAVTALAERLVALGRMPDAAAGRIVNIGPIEGGSATNVVPDLARAWGNVRFPTPQEADVLARMIDALATDPGAMPSVTVRRSFNRPAKPLTPATERLAREAQRAAEDLGQRLPFGKTGGVCDGNILHDAGLTTIDTLGARGGGLHTTQEWIEIASLVERAQLTAVLISRLAADGR